MGQVSSIYRVGWLYAKKRRTQADKKARKRRKMPYAKFLQSEYWQNVREAVFARDGRRCSRCKSPENLHVHHTTYQYRGDEMRHLETLIVLCGDCHARHHCRPVD